MNWIMPALCSSSWASPTHPSPHIVVVLPSWFVELPSVTYEWFSPLLHQSLYYHPKKNTKISPSVTTQLLIELSQSLHAGKQR